MQLSARLEAVASCVKPGRIIADIGTDHAYLPCALIERGVAVKAYACDIAPGPLKRAQNTIAQAGLQRQIIPILTPGLQDVPAEVQTVIIAGMGWISAREILEQAEERLADLDAETVLAQMEQMERSGTTFQNKQRQDTRIRFVAPVVVTVLTVLLMGALAGLIVWGYTIDVEEAPPLPLVLTLAALPLLVVGGVLLALVQRIREIERGEEDDARQF